MSITVNACRICLKSDSDNRVIFDVDSQWSILFNFCTGLTVSNNDVPKVFCGECAILLKQFADFKQLCLKNDDYWNKNIKLEVVENEESEMRMEEECFTETWANTPDDDPLKLNNNTDCYKYDVKIECTTDDILDQSMEHEGTNSNDTTSKEPKDLLKYYSAKEVNSQVDYICKKCGENVGMIEKSQIEHVRLCFKECVENEEKSPTKNDYCDTPLHSKPSETLIEAQNSNEDLLLSSNLKSNEKYKVNYDNFILWKTNAQRDSFSENVFMDYFNEMANKYKSSTLWCMYSMLKNTVKIKHGIDIKTYSNLTLLLKRYSEDYTGKKAKVLSASNVEKFLKEAPDCHYLATKVALIFGIAGACKSIELVNLTTKDIENHGNMILVKVRNNKNKIPRAFIVDGPFYEIVKKYQALRVPNTDSDRFFQNFRKGKCVKQVIGKNKFGQMVKEIAEYLGLPDAELYTGHSFKRTSTDLLANSVAEKAYQRASQTSTM